MEQDKGYQKFNNLSSDTNNILPVPIIPTLPNSYDGEENEIRKVRLRAVESEKDHFFKVMNVRLIRRLVLAEAIASILIVVAQVITYSLPTGDYKNYKLLDLTAIAIWGPLIFFSLASGLSWLTTKSPSGCTIGSAMGFQIVSTIISIMIVIFSVISLTQHGIYKGCDYINIQDCRYVDHEGRIFCSLIIFSAGTVFVLTVFISIIFCKATCCCAKKYKESMIFDVEMAKSNN